MKKLIFLFVFIFGICFCTCKKNPPKGQYLGTFEGNYTQSNNSSVSFTSYYSFQINKSSKKEIKIQELSTNTLSTLNKQSNDSIIGVIGFSDVYSPTGENGVTLSMINIRGKSFTDNGKNYIRGTFSGYVYPQNGLKYASVGNFLLVSKE